MLVHAVAPYYAQGAEPTERDARFQQLVYALKGGRRWRHRSGNYVDPAEVIARYVARHGSPVLGPDRLLVPMPRSTVTPERIRASQWPALRLARALTDIGLGDGVEAVVRRATTIRSSRTNPHDRPTVVEQIATLEVGYSTSCRSTPSS